MSLQPGSSENRDQGLGVGGRKGIFGKRPSIISPLVFIIYTLLTLILTHPLLFNLSSTVPNDIGDPLLNTWIMAWDSHALLTDPLSLFNANIFYPLPNTLAYSEHLFSTAILALPLQLISAEPIVAYNLSLLTSFPLAAFGMYLLTLRWTGQRRAAFIAGLIFAFAPYRFAAIAHLQLLTFQWLPYTLLFIDKLITPKKPAPSLPPPPSSLLLTPYSLLLTPYFLLLQLLASWYLALYTLLIVAIYLLAALFTRRLSRPAILQLSFSFLISFFLILPFAWPYLSLLDDLRAARPLSLALSLAAAPTDFTAAAPFNHFFGPLTESFRTRPGFSEENTLFLGVIAPLLAFVSFLLFLGLRSNSSIHPTHYALRTTLYALLPLLILSLTLTFPTPYATLAHLIPPSTIIRVPPRWIIPALFILAGLAAFSYSAITFYVSRFTFHAAPTLFLLTCTGLLLEAFSSPLPLAPVENRANLNPAYYWLARQPGDISLIELPLHSAPAPEYPEVKRLYASTLGWWKLVNGYSGYTPPRQPALAQALTDFPGPNALTTLQNLTQPFTTTQDRPSTPPTLQPSTLPSLHPSTLPTFLLIHPGEAPFDRTDWETTTRWQAERHPALLPIDQFDGDYLYQILPPNPTRFTTPPLATFGPHQSIQLLTSTLQPPNPPTSQPSNLPTLQSSPPRLILYWQATSPLPADYTIFIHLRAADGFVRSQADGPPVSGHYSTAIWQPNEIIQDIHPLPETDFTQIDHLAVGLYDPASGERLPAFDPTGKRLSEDALIIPLH